MCGFFDMRMCRFTGA